MSIITFDRLKDYDDKIKDYIDTADNLNSVATDGKITILETKLGDQVTFSLDGSTLTITSK